MECVPHVAGFPVTKHQTGAKDPEGATEHLERSECFDAHTCFLGPFGVDAEARAPGIVVAQDSR